MPGDHVISCAVCGSAFKAKRATAQCCSGKCRVALSRARRVADVALSLATAETSLAYATTALRKVRELVEAGASKIAP
jgi:predicted nucleic acid-binding Zn ribbon protein